MTENVIMCVIIMTPTSYPALKEAASLSPWSCSLLCSWSATSCEVAPTWVYPCIRDLCVSPAPSHLLATPRCLRAQQGAASSLQRGHPPVERGPALAACKCRVSAVLPCGGLTRVLRVAPAPGLQVGPHLPRGLLQLPAPLQPGARTRSPDWR